MRWKTQSFWLLAGRDIEQPDTVGVWLIVHPRPDLTWSGCLVAGWHFEVKLRLPKLSIRRERVNSSRPWGC